MTHAVLAIARLNFANAEMSYARYEVLNIGVSPFQTKELGMTDTGLNEKFTHHAKDEKEKCVGDGSGKKF
jgi:hypothetical protein